MRLAEAAQYGIRENDALRYFGRGVGSGYRFDFTSADLRQLVCAKALVANSETHWNRRPTKITSIRAMELCEPARFPDSPGRTLVFHGDGTGGVELVGLLDIVEARAVILERAVTRLIPVPCIF